MSGKSRFHQQSGGVEWPFQEDAELEKEGRVLQSAEKIVNLTRSISMLLSEDQNAVTSALAGIEDELSRLHEVDDVFSQWSAQCRDSRIMLEELGHEVITVRDGQAALNRYQEERKAGRPIDITIMDLTIPGGMGGKEAVQQLLALDRNARVVVSSGYSNDPILADCQEFGFVGAIVKPYRLDELRRTIDQVLER